MHEIRMYLFNHIGDVDEHIMNLVALVDFRVIGENEEMLVTVEGTGKGHSELIRQFRSASPHNDQDIICSRQILTRKVCGVCCDVVVFAARSGLVMVTGSILSIVSR